MDKKTLRELKRFYKWELSPNLDKRQKYDLRFSIFSYRMERESLGNDNPVTKFPGLEGYWKKESVSGEELEALEALILKDLWPEEELRNTMETGDELEWLMGYYEKRIAPNFTKEQKEALSERMMDYINAEMPAIEGHLASEFPELARYWPKKHMSLRQLLTIQGWLDRDALDEELGIDEEWH
jgi:hypothetical protein